MTENPSMRHSIMVHNVLLPTAEHPHGVLACVTVDGEIISGVYTGDEALSVAENHTAVEVVDGGGAMLLPGVIDCHVHFRDPGLTHKADMATESRAAVAGGVTSFIDMPNTLPQTTHRDALMRKHERAALVSVANYGFFIGATSDNLRELLSVDYHSEAAGVKVFMGSSTGNMLVDGGYALDAIFSECGAPIVVHAENQDMINENTARFKAAGRTTINEHWLIRSAEACVRSTEEAMNRAVRYGSRLHVAHLSTEAETHLFDKGDVLNKTITCEVSPLHLTFSCDDYAKLGARIKVNPAIKTPADRAALLGALTSGRIDIVATDHAPHLLSEKDGDVFHAVSGAPMLQFSLPVMLDMLSPYDATVRMSMAPAQCFGIKQRGAIAPGMYADMVLVKKTDPYLVTDAHVVSRCGWTPLCDRYLNHKVVRTWVNGHTAFNADSQQTPEFVAGKALSYS